MRIATLLLCLLGTASARMLSSGNENSAEFPECEACANSIDDLATAMTDPSRRIGLKGTLQHICRGLPVLQTDCVDFVNNDEKLVSFLREHIIRNLKSVCGSDGEGRCRQNPSSGTAVLQLMADRFRMRILGESTSQTGCDGCKSTLNELWSLLGNEDAQIELKGYAKSMCTTFWNVRLAFLPPNRSPADDTRYPRNDFETDHEVLIAASLIMHMIPPTDDDTNWCRDGTFIDQHWSEIVQLIRSAIESSRVDQFCTEINQCSYIDRDQSNWRDPWDIINQHYTTAGDTHFDAAVERFTANTVRGYKATCVLCQLSQDRVSQVSVASLMGHFIHHSQNDHVDEGCAVIGAGLGLSVEDEKIANCRRQVNNVVIPKFFEYYGEKIKEIYGNIFPNSCSGYRDCTAQQVSDLDAMSESEKQELVCETCKHEISSAKETLQHEMCRKGLKDNTVQSCPSGLYAMFETCEALMDKYLPDYFGKLGEHINPDHVCAAMNLCPSVNSDSSSSSSSSSDGDDSSSEISTF